MPKIPGLISPNSGVGAAPVTYFKNNVQPGEYWVVPQLMGCMGTILVSERPGNTRRAIMTHDKKAPYYTTRHLLDEFIREENEHHPQGIKYKCWIAYKSTERHRQRVWLNQQGVYEINIKETRISGDSLNDSISIQMLNGNFIESNQLPYEVDCTRGVHQGEQGDGQGIGFDRHEEVIDNALLPWLPGGDYERLKILRESGMCHECQRVFPNSSIWQLNPFALFSSRGAAWSLSHKHHCKVCAYPFCIDHGDYWHKVNETLITKERAKSLMTSRGKGVFNATYKFACHGCRPINQGPQGWT